MALDKDACVICKVFVATCVILNQEVCQACGMDLLAHNGENKDDTQQDTSKDNSGVV